MARIASGSDAWSGLFNEVETEGCETAQGVFRARPEARTNSLPSFSLKQTG
jgi:hypothetical protein